jgi:hypothetical protein
MFWMGLFPRPFLARMEPSVSYFIEQYQTKSHLAEADRLQEADSLAAHEQPPGQK